MNTIFNSLDKDFKMPTGPLPAGEVLTLRVKIPKYLNPAMVLVTFREYQAEHNSFTLHMKYEKEKQEEIYYKLRISNLEVNIYQYYFSFESYGHRRFIQMCDNSWEGTIQDYLGSNLWQLTVYTPIKTHPNMNSGIMYQIFPDRFYRSGSINKLPEDRIYRSWGELPFYENDTIGKDFFGGDIKGIIKKLDYLKKLNVSVIYLNPIWEAQSNHRYNTGSYEKVDPVLGTMKDLKLLVKKAHSNGMIIILDAVLNHVGSDSIYFNKYNRYPNEGAYNSTNSLFFNWFYFKENRNDYESWWGFETLPKVNQNNPDFIKYVFDEGGIIDQWYMTGIDGLRLDVADELENSTLNKIYEASKRNRDRIVIVGEVWDNASNKCNYGHRMNYLLGSELTSVMNYPIKDALLAYVRYGEHWANELKRILISIFVEDYPKEIAKSLMNFLSTHDTVRAITKLAGEEVDNNDKNWQFHHDKLTRDEYVLGRKRLIISYLILYFLPGIPSIFYGDEIGISGQKDPFCRKCFNWDRIDKKILKFMRSIGKIRHSLADVLGNAEFDVCEIDNEKCIFVRFTKNRYIFVLVNRSDKRISFDSKKYITNYLEKKFNKKLNKIEILFNLNKESFITSINSYGAIVVEATVTN